MLDLVWLIPALPLAGFVVLVVFGRRMGEPVAGWFAMAMVAAAFVVTVGVHLDLRAQPIEERHSVTTLFSWLPVGGLKVDIGFLADPLSITMCLFVTGVSALIHMYSIGYMHGDPKFSKFFTYLNLFVFSMLMLILGDNLLVTFLGWEGVGACSYFLISFWFTRESAATAGKKAFITNRVGDWGFMIAMFLIFQYLGTLNYSGEEGWLAHVGSLNSGTAAAIALLLFVGAVGKSAQIPLYIWLPDAMEGPTPVSALIHAATMVTAGVYLMCRVSPLLFEVPGVGTVIAIVGAATALLAATIAVAQKDIKKVLAYSTVSQLGYMFLAVGCEAYTAAIFHMITHAFFKALLFLGAGSVIHGMHDEQDMRRMGRLAKYLPLTCVTFIIGWLAIAGVPPFSGFWSKDEILASAFEKSWILWAVGLITAILTAYYMTRQVIMVFFGEAHWTDDRPAPEPVVAKAVGAAVNEAVMVDDHHDDHGAFTPHESNWLMVTPLVVLAGLAVVAGLIDLPFGGTDFLAQWLEPVFGRTEHLLDESNLHILGFAGIATLGSLLGIFVAYLVYQRRRLKALEPELFEKGWYYDIAVTRFMGGPGYAIFEGIAWFDRHVVDGAVNGAAWLARWSGSQIRKLQTGYVRNYALGIGIGAVLLLGWFVSRGVF